MSFFRARLLNSALHGSRLLVGEPVGLRRLEAHQDLDRRNARRLGEPGAYLLVQVIQHGWRPRDRFAPPEGATIGRTLLAFPLGCPQPGGKTFEIRWSCRLAGSVQSAAIDPLAELGLSSTDLGDQRHRIRLGLKSPQCLLALLSNGRMRENSSSRDCRGVIALDDRGANAGPLLELERRLEQVDVQSGGGKESNQGLRRPQALQPAIADQAANDRAVFLLDPGLIVLALGTRPCDLQTVTAAPCDDRFVHKQAVIVKVDAAQLERKQRHCAGKSLSRGRHCAQPMASTQSSLWRCPSAPSSV